MDYKYKCCLVPSGENFKDFMTTAIIPQDTLLPSNIEWNVPYIRNQGSFGSCVGFGTMGNKNSQEYADRDLVDGGFSPLFIYTICKSLDGCPNQEGTQIRIALQVLKDYGICPEKDLPYNLLTSPFGYPTITNDLKIKASPYKISSYARIPDKNVLAVKQALQYSPVPIGVLVTDGFVNAKDGFAGTPNGYILGGHCLYVVAYDDNMTHTNSEGITKKGYFKFANSWGSEWGDKGFGYISYDEWCYQLDDGYGYPFIFESWSNTDIITNPNPIKPTVKYWKVQVGAFSIKSNCQAFVEKLKLAGFDTYMPPIGNDGLYRVQVGAFINKDSAYALRDRLLQAGFIGAFVVYK